MPLRCPLAPRDRPGVPVRCLPPPVRQGAPDKMRGAVRVRLCSRRHGASLDAHRWGSSRPVTTMPHKVLDPRH